MFKKYITNKSGEHIVKCDKCSARIKLNNINILDRVAPLKFEGQEVEVHYFVCPNDKCGEEFIINYYTAEMVKEIEAQNNLKMQIASLIAAGARTRSEVKRIEGKSKEWEKRFNNLLIKQKAIKEFFTLQRKENQYAGVQK